MCMKSVVKQNACEEERHVADVKGHKGIRKVAGDWERVGGEGGIQRRWA